MPSEKSNTQMAVPKMLAGRRKEVELRKLLLAQRQQQDDNQWSQNENQLDVEQETKLIDELKRLEGLLDEMDCKLAKLETEAKQHENTKKTLKYLEEHKDRKAEPITEKMLKKSKKRRTRRGKQKTNHKKEVVVAETVTTSKKKRTRRGNKKTTNKKEQTVAKLTSQLEAESEKLSRKCQEMHKAEQEAQEKLQEAVALVIKEKYEAIADLKTELEQERANAAVSVQKRMKRLRVSL